MVSVTIKELLEAGVHFGHQTRRWNPRMKKYIFEERNHIYIVDLHKTAEQAKRAFEFIRNIVAEGSSVLFVGTKKQAKDAILEAAKQSNMFFVNERWLGGTLTNNRTIKESVLRLRELEKMEEEGIINLLSKKEASSKRREKIKLHKYLDGIKDMERLPGVLFVVDIRKERIAIAEARKLKIPVVAIVDTNCNPDKVDICIPGNDDAIRAIRLLVSRVAQASVEGASMGVQRKAEEEKKEAKKEEEVKVSKEKAVSATSAAKAKVKEAGLKETKEKKRKAEPKKEVPKKKEAQRAPQKKKVVGRKDK